ncbi:heavy-metal-associated domain-containing protein [uncultured Maribacter sp.]|uniref:heavy-metal-associated domain-containing protein n=1 Tax=uncultured Maribacter sp. TaxID=431308 RepID=UPI00260DED57|nr:heavy-metal-associated domain-containing protein [uncultured Maribacter sp.]
MKTSFIVQNLKCEGCAKTITNKLNTLNNITEVLVNPNNSTVSFSYRKEEDQEIIKNKLQSLGYPTIDSENSILAKAASFVSCATGKLSK